jgi:hypothetical protein
VTPVDLGLAAAGRLAAAIERRTGGRRRAWYVVTGLVLVSTIWVLLIGSSPRPTDLTFEDVRLERIPAMTSWVRLEGDLRPPDGGVGDLFKLYDLKDPNLYLYLSNASSLALGHQIVTGHISPRRAETGNVGTLIADVPAVPKANEPFAVILFPAALGAFVAMGITVGYPVRRDEGRSKAAPRPLPPGDSVAVRWSGRIEGRMVSPKAPISATVSVEGEPDRLDVTIAGPPTEAAHVVRTRRPAPATPIRLCRLGGCEPALEIHAPTADLLMVFADRDARDRLAATMR